MILNPQELKKDVRMNHGLFRILCNMLEPHLNTSVPGKAGRPAVSVVDKVAVALRYLGGNATVNFISSVQGIAKSTGIKCLWQVIECINEHLVPNLVTYPTGERLELARAQFEAKCYFPNIIGAVDGTQYIETLRVQPIPTVEVSC